MIFTGCLCVNELTTNCVFSSSNACTSWLHRTRHQWLFLYWQLQHVAICVPQAKVICWCQGPKLWVSALEALQLRARRRGTVCQRLWRTRCWQLDNSATGWRQKCSFAATIYFSAAIIICIIRLARTQILLVSYFWWSSNGRSSVCRPSVLVVYKHILLELCYDQYDLSHLYSTYGLFCLVWWNRGFVWCLPQLPLLYAEMSQPTYIKTVSES